MYPTTVDPQEILNYTLYIITDFMPIISALAILLFSFSAVRYILSIFQTEGEMSSFHSDPRNYYLRKFDTIAEEIKKLSPPASLLNGLPVYRQSLENISALNTESANDASAQILQMVTDIRDKLSEQRSIRLISKNKANLADLAEELAKLDDNLSALIEVKKG